MKSILLSFFLLFSGGLFAEDIQLKPNNVVIVKPVSAERFENRAAVLLQHHLRKLYGKEGGFSIINDSKAEKGSKVLIFIGATTESDQSILRTKNDESFSIQSNKNIVKIYGRNSKATIAGVGYFLNKYCDIRTYMPMDGFTHYPEIDVLTIPDQVTEVVEPRIESVWSTGFSGKIKNKDGLSEIDFQMLNGLGRKNFASHQHTFNKLFPVKEYSKKYPLIYPVMNGKRYVPKGKKDHKWQPDFCEDQLIDASVDAAIKHFKKDSSVQNIAFSVLDSKNYSREGKLGEYLKASGDTSRIKKKAYTSAYIDYLNQLCERLEVELPANGISTPKTVMYIAYSYVREVPQVKLHDWILPIFVFKVGELALDRVFTNRGKFNNPEAWTKATSRIGHHDWAHGKGFLMPRLYTSNWQLYLDKLEELKLDLEFVHLECYPNWSLDGPKYYYMGQMFMNSDFDLKASEKQFTKDMFGKAHRSMKKYFRSIEDYSLQRMNRRPEVKHFRYTSQFNINDDESKSVARARKFLDRAKRKAKKEDLKQVQFFDTGFTFFEMLLDAYNAAQNDKVKHAAKIKDYIKNVLKKSPEALYMLRDQKLLDSNLKKILNDLSNE